MYKGYIKATVDGWDWGVVYADNDGDFTQTVWATNNASTKEDAKHFAMDAAKRMNQYGDQIHVIEPEI